MQTLGKLTIGGLVIVGASIACRESSATPKTPQVAQQASPATGSATAAQEVLGTIGDEKITMAEVRERAADDLDKLETQYQLTKARIIRGVLDSIVREKTIGEEAKKKGKTVDELVAAEMSGGLEPTELDIQQWYKDNSARLNGRKLDELRSQIADLLRSQRRVDAAQKLEDRLRAERKVHITYEPYRLQFANGSAPVLGKKDAPITLVEFSDFQCPFCQRMAPVLRQVADKYRDKVQIVYRQYPIPSLHPFAFKAAEASLCAQEQGKFWEMHDAMFQDQKKLGVSDLKETAKRLGMDAKKFNGCLDSGRYVEQVQNDSREAQRAGVTGTPAVFINGIVVEGGAVPLETVETYIEKELARQASKG